jgi:hypothetical protein
MLDSNLSAKTAKARLRFHGIAQSPFETRVFRDLDAL